jgi:non-specific serine/threonine protein kinase/serine/threonine-protein kinase
MNDTSPERRRRIAELFDAAAKLPPDRRSAFLDNACPGDVDLKHDVVRLLESANPPRSPDPADGTTLTMAPSSHASDHIGPYRLMQRVGEGGMGEVWLAEQTAPIRRQVALKVIKAGMDTKQVVARFEAERQALALMDHPAIAKVFDAGETNRGLPFFAMEYVKGEPITSYCDRHLLTNRERLELFVQVCEGVQHAHQKGVIHRDLKPSNVLVTVQDGSPVPKIIDFGVAKAVAQRLTEKTMFTELGVLVGTPEYMSPEQAEMTGLDIDTRTDVYALGILLYQLLVGALPFDPTDLRKAGLDEIRRRIRQVDPPRPSTRISTMGVASTESAKNRRTEPGKLASQLRGDLDWITMKTLEKDRTRRYGSPSELAADIGRHLRNEPVLAGPPSAVYRAGKFVRRHRLGVAVAAAGILGLAGFAGTMAAQAKRIARERDRAERVSEFLVDLFKVSDPGEARGNSITAREVLDRGADHVQEELEKEPEVLASLLQTMGGVYMGLGLYSKAEKLFERCGDIRHALFGEEDPQTLQCRQAQAYAILRVGRIEEAQRRFKDLIAVRRRVLGDDNPDTLQSLDNYATTLEEQGNYREAGPIYRQVLEARLRVLGRDTRLTNWSFQNVGFNLLQQAMGTEAGAKQKALYAESEKMLREGIAGFGRVLGPDHPDTLWARRNLVQCLESQNRLSEAEALQREVLETSRRVLGADHVGTRWGESILARILAGEKRYDEAEALYRGALDSLRRTLGPEHSRTLAVMFNMASGLYLSQGDYEKAELLLRDVYATATRIHDDAYLRDVAYNLGCFSALRGNRREALDWLRKSVEAGFSDGAGMSQDPDLASLRGDAEFDRIIAAAENKNQAHRLP